ncbi:hypothetical protein BH09ACT8_BH09ACT8_10040 [soil metagenome]
MTLQVSDASVLHEPNGLRSGGIQAHAGRPLKYQLTVVGSTVADVVTSAGGWLFDRGMAGWEVNVLLPELPGPTALRPLDILGARCCELDSALGSMKKGPHPHALAVANDLFDYDDRVRQAVLAAMRRGSTEISFWGPGAPTGIDRTVAAVEHPLTAAARVFKAQALVAAAAPEMTDQTESFLSGGSSFR